MTGVEIPEGVSIRCRICGEDIMDPEHKPELCEAVASIPRASWGASPFGAVEAGYDRP